MGFRFFRRIKVAPGLTLNLSKSGVSTSVGVRGARLTFGGKRGPRATVGIPGTGLSYTETLKAHEQAVQAPPEARRRSGWSGWLMLLLVAIAVGYFVAR